MRDSLFEQMLVEVIKVITLPFNYQIYISSEQVSAVSMVIFLEALARVAILDDAITDCAQPGS